MSRSLYYPATPLIFLDSRPVAAGMVQIVLRMKPRSLGMHRRYIFYVYTKFKIHQIQGAIIKGTNKWIL